MSKKHGSRVTDVTRSIDTGVRKAISPNGEIKRQLLASIANGRALSHASI
jgi:hypothetical protein